MNGILLKRWGWGMLGSLVVAATVGAFHSGELMRWATSLRYSGKTPVGTVTAQYGTTYAYLDDAKRLLAKGDGLYEGDNIVTGGHSRVVLTMTDDAVVALGENTEFKVSKYQYMPDNPNGVGVMNLAKGFMKITSGKLAKFKSSPFKVITPVATLGVRGTEYFCRLDEKGKNGEEPKLDCIVLTPVVEVMNDEGMQLLDKPELSTQVVSRHKAPSKPRPASLKELILAKLAITLPEKVREENFDYLTKKLAESYLKRGVVKEPEQAKQLAEATMRKIVAEAEWRSTKYDMTKDFR